MDPDESARMRRLIWIHAGRNRLKVGFPVTRLKCVNHYYEDRKSYLIYTYTCSRSIACSDLRILREEGKLVLISS